MLEAINSLKVCQLEVIELDKRVFDCKREVEKLEKNNENTVKILNLTKHRVYEKVVGDLDNILEEYFSI